MQIQPVRIDLGILLFQQVKNLAVILMVSLVPAGFTNSMCFRNPIGLLQKKESRILALGALVCGQTRVIVKMDNDFW